jgi:hypothetical protein
LPISIINRSGKFVRFVFYNGKSIGHPALACQWVDPGTRDFAFLVWLDEMRIVADVATK